MPWLRIRLVAIALLVVGCSHWRPAEPAIDGWPLGDEVSCGPSTPHDVIGIAFEQLTATGSAVTDTRCYREGLYESGTRLVTVRRSGGVVIVVFSFADGTRHARGVYCNGPICMVDQRIDHEPPWVTVIPFAESATEA